MWRNWKQILHKENCIKNELEVQNANTKTAKLISRVRTTIRTVTLSRRSKIGKRKQ